MKKIIKILGLFIFTMFIYATCSNAAISASSTTVNSGEEATIAITSDVAVTSYKVTLTDLGGTTFVTSSGGTGEGTQSITDASTNGMTKLATFKIKVPEVTTDTTYSISFIAEAMDDVELNPVPNSTATAKITVKAPVTPTPDPEPEPPTPTTPPTPVALSTNANLRNLGIQPNDFSGFKAGTLKYNTAVPNNVEKVNIYAYTQDAKAKAVGTGNKNLSVGDNTFDIIVTAEDGKTTKTYTLVIHRKTKEETEADNKKPEENKVEVSLESLEIAGITLTPSFDKNTYKYSAKLTKDIDKLEVKAIASDEKVTVKIEGNEGLKTGENTIKVKLTSASGKTAEYTITVNKDLTEEKKGLSELKVEGITLSPSFDSDVYNYVATLTEDLKKLKVTALNSDGTTDGIEITGNGEIEFGENTITILVNDKKSGETLTYQILITKELQKEEETTKKGTNIGKIILIVAAIIIIIALIILLKPKKNKNAFEEDEEDDNFNDDTFNPFEGNSNNSEMSNIEDSQNQIENENNYNLDRKNEYNVFEDTQFLKNDFENNNYNIEEDIEESDDEIEERKNRLKGKRKGKHF